MSGTVAAAARRLAGAAAAALRRGATPRARAHAHSGPRNPSVCAQGEEDLVALARMHGGDATANLYFLRHSPLMLTIIFTIFFGSGTNATFLLFRLIMNKKQ